MLGTHEGHPSYTHRLRVGYVDTDAAGVMHHSQYLRYLEHGRVELLRAVGVDYLMFERERSLALPVVDVRMKYRAPARFDDLLDVETWVSEGSRAKLVFTSKLRRVADGVLLHEGAVTVACVQMPKGTLCSMPADLVAKLRGAAV